MYNHIYIYTTPKIEKTCISDFRFCRKTNLSSTKPKMKPLTNRFRAPDTRAAAVFLFNRKRFPRILLGQEDVSFIWAQEMRATLKVR